jgi:hypothetical protein
MNKNTRTWITGWIIVVVYGYILILMLNSIKQNTFDWSFWGIISLICTVYLFCLGVNKIEKTTN